MIEHRRVIGQTPGRGRADAEPRRPSGVARTVRETVLGTAETARASHAARKAARREEARPALTRAIRSARDAESSLSWLQVKLEDTARRGRSATRTRDEVCAVEAEIEEARRDWTRYAAATRALERQVGVIRDPSGHVIDSGV